MRSDSPTPLSREERELLNALLAHDFVGVQELREQAGHLLAKRGCDCGCGTIDFVLDGSSVPRSGAASPVPVEGLVFDEDGVEIGGLILFLEEGTMKSLEVYSHDEQPLPLPRREQVTWLE